MSLFFIYDNALLTKEENINNKIIISIVFMLIGAVMIFSEFGKPSLECAEGIDTSGYVAVVNGEECSTSIDSHK